MAPKDYIKRGRAEKKPPPPPPFPWLRMMLALVLLGAFGYFLWSLKNQTPSHDQDKPKAPQQEQQSKTISDEPLPILADEEWEFIKTLPQTSVEVEVAEQQKSDKRYLMQCGSFRKQSQAQEMKATIAFQGLVAQVRESSGKNGLWHRVILGPYDTKRLAEKDRHLLRKASITTCQIWYWNL